MSKLRIDCGHGVTEIVNVAPNTTLGEVLGEVCTRGRGASSSRPGLTACPGIEHAMLQRYVGSIVS